MEDDGTESTIEVFKEKKQTSKDVTQNNTKLLNMPIQMIGQEITF